MIDAKRKGRYRVLCEEREIAGACDYSPALSFRMKGLLGRKELKQGAGILLLPCNSIHMWFMAFSIDAIFLNKSGKVVALYESIRPWRISGLHWEAYAVLEVAAGVSRRMGLKKGDKLSFCSVS